MRVPYIDEEGKGYDLYQKRKRPQKLCEGYMAILRIRFSLQLARLSPKGFRT